MSLPDDYLNIDTPENVTFGYDVAGIGSRFLAALVDTLLIIVLLLIVNITLLFLITNLFRQDLNESRPLIWMMVAVFGLITFAFLWGYYIFFEMIWNGQSPGKRWVGLRVIRADGAPITLTESIIRNLVRMVDLLPMFYGIGVVSMFINAQSRRLGDLAAGTLVVQDRSQITLENLGATITPPAYSSPTQTAADLPTERLSYQDLQMAEEFLRRRYELTNRAVLAKQLAQTLRQRLNLPPESMNGEEAEKFIIELVQAQRKRDVDAL